MLLVLSLARQGPAGGTTIMRDHTPILTTARSLAAALATLLAAPLTLAQGGTETALGSRMGTARTAFGRKAGVGRYPHRDRKNRVPPSRRAVPDGEHLQGAHRGGAFLRRVDAGEFGLDHMIELAPSDLSPGSGDAQPALR